MRTRLTAFDRLNSQAQCLGRRSEIVRPQIRKPGLNGKQLAQVIFHPKVVAQVGGRELGPDRLVERRRVFGGRLRVKRDGRLPAAPAPELVPNPVQDGLTKVRPQGAGVVWLEEIDPLEGLEQGVLDEIVGVGNIARPSGSRPLA